MIFVGILGSKSFAVLAFGFQGALSQKFCIAISHQFANLVFIYGGKGSFINIGGNNVDEMKSLVVG